MDKQELVEIGKTHALVVVRIHLLLPKVPATALYETRKEGLKAMKVGFEWTKPGTTRVMEAIIGAQRVTEVVVDITSGSLDACGLFDKETVKEIKKIFPGENQKGEWRFVKC